MAILIGAVGLGARSYLQASRVRWVEEKAVPEISRLINENKRLAALALFREAERYAPGSRGITPHRDHLRYGGLVALVILSGDGRFCLCRDRCGSNAREIAAGPGDALLMRAPGLAGSSDRPFHFLDQITKERLSFGLRWDREAARHA